MKWNVHGPAATTAVTPMDDVQPTHQLPAHHERVRQWLLLASIAAPAACALGSIYATVAWTSWPAVRFLLFYVAPMGVAVPWWARERIRWLSNVDHRASWHLALDVVVLLLAMARFGVGAALPWSGHMLFLTYSAITTDARTYRALVVLLLVETTIFKLLVWQDKRSWAIGLALGVLAGVVVKVRESAPESR
jgi:hypothetical protein